MLLSGFIAIKLIEINQELNDMPNSSNKGADNEGIVPSPQGQSSLDVYSHPAGKIVRAIDAAYSAVDLTVHDLNVKGRIEKTFARTRAKHHPLYGKLFSDD